MFISSTSFNRLNQFKIQPKLIRNNFQSYPIFRGNIEKDTFESSTKPKKQDLAPILENKEQIDTSENIELSQEEQEKFQRLRKNYNYRFISDSDIKKIIRIGVSDKKIADLLCVATEQDLNPSEITLLEKYQSEYSIPKHHALALVQNGYTEEEIAQFLETRTQIPELEEALKKFNMSSGNFITFGIIDNRIFDIQDFKKYLESLDEKEIFTVAPMVENYSSRDMGDFLTQHYKLNTRKFDEDTLTIKNLTEILSENYINASKMHKLFSAFPLTSRNVGEIPDGWLENIDKENRKEAEEEIFDICDKFSKQENKKQLEEELRAVLNKNVEVKYCGGGDFGRVYKISVENSIPVCIKVFFENDEDEYYKNKFGQFIEPQLGFLVNNYSDDFVKTYFAKIGDIRRSNGYMVCQFLNENTKADKTAYKKNSPYTFRLNDNHSDNYINGKIIDLGAVEVYKNNHKIHRWNET